MAPTGAVDSEVADSTDTACSWDDGFPAIASDGSLIATKVIPDDSGRGYPGLTVQFVDSATSRVVREAGAAVRSRLDTSRSYDLVRTLPAGAITE